MAESTKYGPWVATDDWRSWVGVSISSSTDTTATITVRGWFESKYGSSTGSGNVRGWVGYSIGSGSVTWAPSGGVAIDPFSEGAGKYYYTKSWTITKTHAAQTVWGYADVEGTAGIYDDTKSECYASVSVPAKSSYAVTYNANGGSGAPSSQVKWHGEALTLSSTTPTRSGYTFRGWGTSSSSTSASYQAGGSYTANAAVTLYAIWSKTLTLTYNANGGSGAPASQSATLYNAQTSATIKLSSSTPTRSGWSFVGWGTTASSTSASYQPSGSVQMSGNTTLYAIWSKTLTLTYNANGGSGAPSAQKATIYNATTSKTFAISTTMPTRTNYNFKGWALSSDAASAAYRPGGSVSISSNTTIYAVWELGYVAPTLMARVFRSDSSGNESAVSTTNISVVVDWSLSQVGGSNTTATLAISVNGTAEQPISLSGTSGSETAVIGGTFPQASQVPVTIVVTDAHGMVSTVYATVAPAFYPLSFSNEGHSAAFFGMAPDDAQDVLLVNGSLLVSGGGVSISGDASWIYIGSDGVSQWRFSKGSSGSPNQGTIQYHNGTSWVNI